jgi:hypothetical protein
MTYLSHSRIENSKQPRFPAFPTSVSIREDVSQLGTDTEITAQVKKLKKAYERRAFFSGDQGGKGARITTFLGPEVGAHLLLYSEGLSSDVN